MSVGTKQPEWDGEGVRPAAGQRCWMATDTSDWQIVTISYISKDGVVAELENGLEAFISASRQPEFKPVCAKERLEMLLCSALRQLRHNNSDGFVAAYDRGEVLNILSRFDLKPKGDAE